MLVFDIREYQKGIPLQDSQMDCHPAQSMSVLSYSSSRYKDGTGSCLTHSMSPS